MNPTRILAIASLLAAGAAMAAGSPQYPVDLDRPGVLEQLKAERPKHYEAVTEVLRVSESLPCEDRQVMAIKARFDIRELACAALIMTSYPPKRRVNFQYDGTSYVAVVTLQGTEGRVLPAKGEAR
jgi:hypothetical protein